MTASSSGLSCSYAGGCTLDVTAQGLSSLLKNDPTNNLITICDEQCTYIESSSTQSSAQCKLPPMSTVYSNANFFIETESEDLKARTFFGNINEPKLPFDEKLVTQPTNSQSTCVIGVGFKADHVALISQMKYFMTNIDNLALYVDILKF